MNNPCAHVRCEVTASVARGNDERTRPRSMRISVLQEGLLVGARLCAPLDHLMVQFDMRVSKGKKIM